MCGHLWEHPREFTSFPYTHRALVLTCAARIVTSAQGNPEAAKVQKPRRLES
jgi:hypothetical protein